MITEDNKYYMPDIEDLHVGYICEVQQMQQGEGVGSYVKSVLNELREMELFDLAEYFNRCKTKYLDKEDIESLGWKEMPKYSNRYIMFELSNRWLGYNLEKHWLKLTVNDPIKELDRTDDLYDESKMYYQGECKSINELKTIMKWLNIK